MSSRSKAFFVKELAKGSLDYLIVLVVYLEDCCGDNTIFVESCGLHFWPFCRSFYQGQSSQGHLVALDSVFGPTFEPEASPAFGHCFVLFIIILSLLPLRHSAGSKTSPLSRFFVFEASLHWILMRLGLFICRLLVSCYVASLSMPVDFGIRYDLRHMA